MLTNNYINVPWMLITSNTLNTSNTDIYSNKVKDVTMRAKQDTNNSLMAHLWRCIHLLSILRDYMWMVILRQLGWLRYSPVFCKYASLLEKRFMLVFKKLINVRLNKRGYSTNGDKLDPLWVTGFADAESCFSIIIEVPGPLKWKVRTSFEINLHEKDQDILYKIQSFFGVGAVYHRPAKKISVYRVSNVQHLNDVIIPHFTKYPLISKKAGDFLLWSKVIQIILTKAHLTKTGFTTILTYYASINRGISKKVLQCYPNIIPAVKPVINLPDSLNPQWVSGFKNPLNRSDYLWKAWPLSKT
jgi:hypothetical protein